MKDVRHFLALPFRVLLIGFFIVTVVVDLIGCAVNRLCCFIEGPQ